MAETPNPKPFASWLDEQIRYRGMTQAEVGRLVDTDGVQVMRWRRGRATPGPEYLARLAKLFGADLGELERLAYLPVRQAVPAEQLEVERSMWHAVYDDLIEKEVPRSMWQTYIEACQALARAFKTIVPDAFSAPEHSSLNANSVNSAPPDDDPDQSPNSKTSRRLPVLTFCEATV